MRYRRPASLIAALGPLTLLAACAGGMIPPSAGGPAPARPAPSRAEPGAAARPVPATPRPVLPVEIPADPALDRSTAAGLGVTRGPDIASLLPSGERSRLALAAFRLSCPSLMRRTDQSGLTRG
jgi:membrane-bound lytic murein transglycosylase A